MPAGGAEGQGESIWSAAEKLAEAHEAKLAAEGKPIPGAEHAPQRTEDSPDPAKPAAAAAGPAKKAPLGAPTPAATDLSELEAIAAKHGMKVNGNRIEPAERVKFREEKRIAQERLQQREAEIARKAAEFEQKSQGSSAKLSAFEKALESRDVDGLAKAIGFKDWKELVNEHTKQLASPEYKRIQELERRDAERQERDRQAEAQRNHEAEQARINESIKAYKVGMAEDLKGRGGQLSAMGEDPELVDFLYSVSADHYRATGDELDLEELVSTPSRLLGNKTPLDLLRSKWEALSAIFSDQAASPEAPLGAARRSGSSPRSREPKVPKTVSQSKTAEASPPAEFKSEKEFMRHFTELLNQSTHVSGG